MALSRLLLAVAALATGSRWIAGRAAAVASFGALLVVIAWPAAASSSTWPSSPGAVSVPADQLVVPAGEWLLGGELARLQWRSRQRDPAAVQRREASRTEFTRIGAGAVSALLRSSLPGVIDAPLAGLPALPGGAHVGRYLSSNAAQLSLPGGRRAIVESAAPFAHPGGHGRFAPIDLSVRASAGGYAPVVTGSPVRIPRRLAGGVSADAGVSIVPVDRKGTPLGGSAGTVDGAVVLYANTVQDGDTLVKPTAGGFQLDAVLRGADSPQSLYYRLSMPAGARLLADGSGGARVALGSTMLVTVSPPLAQDADGTPVPVAMSVRGDSLSVKVEHRSGDFRYPIDVDPEVNDKQLTEVSGWRSNWEFKATNEAKFGHAATGKGLETDGTAEYAETEYAAWVYQTKGVSKIYEFNSESEGKNVGAQIESFIELEAAGANENKYTLSTEFNKPEYGAEAAPPLCAKNAGKVECTQAAGAAANVVRYQQSVQKKPSNFKFIDKLIEGTVFLSEPSGTHATTSYNTTSPELTGEVENSEHKREVVKRLNVLDGGGWLTERNGAVELLSEDKGIGVSSSKLEYETAGKWELLGEHNYLEVEKLCKGVQCAANQKEFWVLDPRLPQGEVKLRYRAKDAMAGTESTTAEGQATVKVDTQTPHGIHIAGLPEGNELSAREYPLTISASDGEGSTVASSGVKSIALYIDGSLIGKNGGTKGGEGSEGKCSVSAGECTATAKWTLKGAELGAGKHDIEVVVVDNALNEAPPHYQPVSIRHAAAVAIGPGAVDPETGSFTLSATDVSLGSGLNVSRSYSSRALEEGDEGPIGPQWTLDLGSTESLVEMVNGSMMLTTSDGHRTIFAKISAKSFEAPTGDSNLKLTVEEHEKAPIAFYLEDAADHSKVKFTLPIGDKTLWMPTKQEGAVSTDTVTYTYRTAEQNTEYKVVEPAAELRGITTGPDGNLWYTSFGIIGKITPTGINKEYSVGTGAESIVTGPDNNLWYTAHSGNKVGKITTTGTSTNFSLPSGSEPLGIASGPDGNLWFADSGSSKIVKMNTSGTVLAEYALPAGSKPAYITSGPSESLWFTESGTHKIGRITPSGAISEYPISAERKPNGITTGTDGNVWFTADVVASGLSTVGKITPTGTVTEYSLPETSVPGAIVAGSDGNLWTVGGNKIDKITPEGVVSEFKETIGADGVTAGPDGNLWVTGTGKVGAITTVGDMIEPTEALAPVPSKVECPTGKLQPGCRALKFVYATSTTAKGEGRPEWGDYKGRLKQVLFEAYNPASKKVEEPGIPVAEYSYDPHGRLRSEWDPRIALPLKKAYGYDEEGHVTAVTPPGGNAWGFVYGQTSTDANPGRLLKANRSSKSPEWQGVAPVNTEAPAITGSAYENSTLAVSTGAWMWNPVVYGYQWQRCNSSGALCEPIAGANNGNYTVSAADIGHTLIATVKATNGGGTVTKSTAATAVVQSPVSEYSLPTGSSPFAIVNGPNKHLWFTDSSSGKVGQISTGGTELTEYAAEKNTPEGITSGPDGKLWFVENKTHHVDSMTTAGALTVYSVPKLTPFNVDIITGPDENLWFTESAVNYIAKVNTKGEVLSEYHVATEEPYEITIGPEKNMWFTMRNTFGRGKIGKITTGGAVSEYSVPKTSNLEPGGIAAGSDGNIWFAASGSAMIDKMSTSGTVLAEYSLPKGSKPAAMVAGPDGNIWFAENGTGKIGRITPAGAIAEYPLPSGSKPRGITVGSDGNIWFTEQGSNKIGRLLIATEGAAQAPQPGWTMEYGVPLEGAGAPAQVGINAETHKPEPEKWGQTDDPVEATSIFLPDSPQGWPASSYTRAMTYYLDEQGRVVNQAMPSTNAFGSVSTVEYSEENDAVRSLTPANRVTALEAGAKSAEVAKLLSTYNTYRPMCSKESENNHEAESPVFGTRLCETEGPQHEIKYTVGKETHEELARDHTKYFYDENVPTGEPYAKETYNLLTETRSYAELSASGPGNGEEVEGRISQTFYSGQGNLGWRLRAPTSTVSDPNGLKVTTTTIYNEETGQVTETRGPAGQAGGSPHDTRTVFYTASENKEEGLGECGNHAEWAGLLCETLPAKKPETSKVPNPPVTLTKYNIWNQPETITETFTEPPAEATVRTKKSTYDSDGRLTASETTVTGPNTNLSVPKVEYEYGQREGELIKESTTVAGHKKTISAIYNSIGQMLWYTDSSGENSANFIYGGAEVDNQLVETTDSSNAGTSKQTYEYNPTTMMRETLKDSAAGTFTATYDVEGKLTSEIYPNGMCANYQRNSAGEAVHLEYIKTTNCSESSPTVWYSESVVPSVRGEMMARTSTLAGENYSYDSLGRLTEVQETPAGGECGVRAYVYDEESNRTNAIARKPGTGGACATSGGTEEKHTYDSGNRLTDAGIEYESLGNVTKLPAADAEKHELTSSFYVTGAVASQSQNGVTNEYTLDLNGRALTSSSGGKTTINHYDNVGEAVAWTCEEALGTESCEAGKSTRNIPGIDGALVAVQANGGTPELQLDDLAGDVVATAALSPSETKLLSTYNSTEFGVPNAEKTPPKFAWLGGSDVARSLNSGVVTYAASSYIPQTGLTLQTQQVSGYPVAVGGGAAYIGQAEPWVWQGAAREAAEAPAIGAAEEREAAEAACRANPAACIIDPRVEGLVTGFDMQLVGEYLHKKAANGDVYVEWASRIPKVGDWLKGIGGSYTAYINAMGTDAEECAMQITHVELTLHDQGTCLVHYWAEDLNIKLFKFKLELEYPLSLSSEVCGKKRGTYSGYYYCWGAKAWYQYRGIIFSGMRGW